MMCSVSFMWASRLKPLISFAYAAARLSSSWVRGDCCDDISGDEYVGGEVRGCVYVGLCVCAAFFLSFL